MYNYFPHPSNARQSSMCVTLLVNEGFAGYGIYWAIIELLRDAPNYKYTADEKLLAYVLHAPDAEQVKRVIKNFGLFDFDNDGLMFSPWLLESLGSYDEQKKKLQEAGRKGAARRWARAQRDNGQAIATPLMDNGQAIAYNPTLFNISEQDKTNPTANGGEEWREVCLLQGLKVDTELVEAIAKTSPEGHAPGYIAQVCCQYGIGQNVLDFLVERTENASTTNPLYIKFCALVKRIETEKWAPKHPANFICSKLFG